MIFRQGQVIDTFQLDGKELRIRTLKKTDVDIAMKYIDPRAIHVYKKVGFKQTGKIPDGIKHKGKYCDEIILWRRLQ